MSAQKATNPKQGKKRKENKFEFRRMQPTG